jgi:hypothetical protein
VPSGGKFGVLAQLASLADETPEGRSIVVLAKEKYGIRGRDMGKLSTRFIPFSVQTRMSGVEIGSTSIRKGAVDAILNHVNGGGPAYAPRSAAGGPALGRAGAPHQAPGGSPARPPGSAAGARRATGIGHGVAIPHARLRAVKKPFALLARLKSPIEFDAVDGRPVDLVFLLLLPASSRLDQLNALAAVARKLRDADVLRRMRSATTAVELYRAATEGQAAASRRHQRPAPPFCSSAEPGSVSIRTA